MLVGIKFIFNIRGHNFNTFKLRQLSEAHGLINSDKGQMLDMASLCFPTVVVKLFNLKLNKQCAHNFI